MICVFRRGGPRCSKPASDRCQNWGVGEGFCDEHIGRVRSRLHGRDFSKDPIEKPVESEFGTYIEDYIKLYALMLDTGFCRTLMTRLNTEIKGGAAMRARDKLEDERFTNAKRPDDKKYVRLSRVLEYYEGLCWFPTVHRLYTGALTSENYQQSIALGYMPKDAGAGAQHGEYSHRLQWHMVMRVITNNFCEAKSDGWNHSPLGLFTKLGDQQSMINGIWGLIFDNQDGKAYDNPAKLNMDLCGNFKWRAEEAELSAAKWRAQNEMLAFNARRRTSKRLAMYTYAKKQLKTYSAERRRLLVDMEVEQNVIGLVERWKKVGMPKGFHRFHFDGPTKAEVTEELARDVWNKFKLDHSGGKYAEEPDEPNSLLRQGEELVTPEQVRNKVLRSRVDLNKDKYAYKEELGAYLKV